MPVRAVLGAGQLLETVGKWTVSAFVSQTDEESKASRLGAVRDAAGPAPRPARGRGPHRAVSLSFPSYSLHSGPCALPGAEDVTTGTACMCVHFFLPHCWCGLDPCGVDFCLGKRDSTFSGKVGSLTNGHWCGLPFHSV